MAHDEVIADHPDHLEIHPPDPIEHDDGSIEYPTDPHLVPSEEPKDLTPSEADDDYSPTEYDEGAG